MAFSLSKLSASVDAMILLSSSAAKRDYSTTWLSGVELYDFSCVVVRTRGMFLLAKPHELSVVQQGRIKDVRALKDNLYGYLAAHVKAKNIGINMRVVSVREMKLLKKAFPNARFVDVSDDVMRLREIKTKEEIALIRKACSIGDEILGLCVKKMKRFSSETDVAAFLLNEIAKRGCEPSFKPIVASGKNAGIIHHSPAPAPLRKGFLIIDFGVRYRNYCSDMTRTFYLGTPSERERALYQRLLAVQEATIGVVKPGAVGKDVDAFSRERLGDLAPLMTHGLGHQIGIETHEGSRNLNSRGEFLLREGMAVTVEPGVYREGRWGLRIEDTCVVGAKGAKVLTKFPKQLISI
ncbi:MAG: Xaa-Pro peptidase family protein [archaeon]